MHDVSKRNMGKMPQRVGEMSGKWQGILVAWRVVPCRRRSKRKDKGKGPVLDIALLHDEHMLRSALQSLKWQLIGMS